MSIKLKERKTKVLFDNSTPIKQVSYKKTKILIVDDYDLNRMFMKKLLTRWDIDHIDLAEDGKKAVEMAKKNKYTLVLMDCHMPEMDGYETTRKIRKQKNDVPIVALTADAISGTKEQCIEAGMNAYITKPVDKTQLKLVLGKWVGFEASDKEEVETPEKDENMPPVNLDIFKEYADSEEEIQRFISIFISQSEESIDILEQNCSDATSDTWEKAAHKLKGAAAMSGITGLARLCEQAQQMSDATEEEKKSVLHKIYQEYQKVKDFLNEMQKKAAS